MWGSKPRNSIPIYLRALTRLDEHGALSLLLQDSFPVELPTANSDGSEHSRRSRFSKF